MKLCILVITTTTTYVMLVHWSPEGDYGRNIEVPSDTNISGTVKTQVVFAIRWRSVCEPVTKLLSWSCVHCARSVDCMGRPQLAVPSGEGICSSEVDGFFTHTLWHYTKSSLFLWLSQFVILFLLMLINKSSLLIVLCCACLLHFLLIFCIKYSANYIWYAFAATNAPSLSAKDLFSSTS